MVFRPNSLMMEVINFGDADYTPLDPKDYEIQVILKKSGLGKLEEYHYSPATDARMPDLPASLASGDLWSLRLDDVYLFTPVQNGEIEISFRASGESNLRWNGSTQAISVQPHEESGWNCAAWIAKAVALVYPPARIPTGLAGWIARMNQCQERMAGSEQLLCYAEATAWWALGMFTAVKDVSEKVVLAIKILVTAHDMQSLLSQVTPPCGVAVDWMNAMVREWMREGLPINAIFVQSPAYPLVTTSAGQRIGFLDNGEIVTEAPGSAAFLNGESKAILYPGTDTAQVRLKGASDGLVNLSITVSLPEGGTTLDYPAFQVHPSTVGTIDRRAGLQTLHLDQNGDGVVDIEVQAIGTEPAQAVLISQTTTPEPAPRSPIDNLEKTIQENLLPTAAFCAGMASLLCLSIALGILLLKGTRPKGTGWRRFSVVMGTLAVGMGACALAAGALAYLGERDSSPAGTGAASAASSTFNSPPVTATAPAVAPPQQAQPALVPTWMQEPALVATVGVTKSQPQEPTLVQGVKPDRSTEAYQLAVASGRQQVVEMLLGHTTNQAAHDTHAGEADQVISDDEQMTKRIAGEKERIEVKPGHCAIWWSWGGEDTGSLFSAKQDWQLIQGPGNAQEGYGMMIRADGNAHYQFSIRDRERQFDVEYWLAGKVETLHDWTFSDAIHPGQVNRIGVVAESSNMFFLINGIAVAAVHDERISEGKMGSFFNTCDENRLTIYETDNFELSK
ncbi:MAG: hypothetical protein JXM73_20365 [Anaerolineae bacterium]|nr:hypothetical protein [Anaerolineae bacterium]